MFTVVVQKGQKLIVGGNEQKAEVRQEKNQMKQRNKSNGNISTLSAKTVSTGGRRNCCHVYKITNTYEGLHSSHRHLKKKPKKKQKRFYFSGALKIQRV